MIVWSEERVEQLKKLWDQGFSASQIAAEMGALTRNSVIGKVHRLGLSGRSRNPQPQAPKIKIEKPRPQRLTPFVARTPRAAPQKVEADPGIEEQERFVPPAIDPRSLLELETNSCRWPIGDTRDPDFHYCGGNAASKSPYCAAHTQIAFQPSSQVRRPLGAHVPRGRR